MGASMTEPLVEVRCVVCAGESYEVICSAAEIQSHEEYLHTFHLRRLRPGPHGSPPPSALTDRADFTQDYATDIVACTGCGLLFRNPRPPAEAIVRTYAQDHYGPHRLAALFASQLELYRPKARYLRRWLPAEREIRIVEIGSFVGGFLAAGQEYGWEMLGIDPGEEVNAFCRERGLRVFQRTLPEAPLEPGSVDCVTIWNTFDQLPNPEPTLSAVCRLLRAGGILVIRVPNGAHFRRAVAWVHQLPRPFDSWLRAGMVWNNLLAFPYLYGYSVRTLDWLLSPYRLQRIALHPDTLPRLADSQTKAWAAGEERALKLLMSLASRLETVRPGTDLTLAPWFDAYYRIA